MKSITLLIGGMLIAINLLFGLLISSYSSFNMLFNTIILVLTTLFVLIIYTVKFLNAVKVSFTILLTASGFIKLIMGTIAPEHIQDNWCVIACLALTMLELIMLTIYSKISPKE